MSDDVVIQLSLNQFVSLAEKRYEMHNSKNTLIKTYLFNRNSPEKIR